MVNAVNNGQSLAVSVAFVNLSVTEAHRVPIIAAEYMIPAVKIAYINLAAAVILDSTGRVRYIRDYVSTSDNTIVRMAYNRVYADSVSKLDQVTILSGKNNYEVMSATDNYQVIWAYNRQYFDTVAAGESIAKSTSRTFADGFTQSDVRSNQFTHVYYEPGATIASVQTYTIPGYFASDYSATNTYSDPVLSSDAISLHNTFYRSFSDSVTAIDTSIYSGLTWSFADTRSDIASVGSSGSLVCQGYCDITYFAADYVGASATFS